VSELSRRAFLGGLLATAACSSSSGDRSAPTTGTTATTAEPTGPDPFTLGVASGDPDATSVVLWTRLLPDGPAPTGDVDVAWEVLDGDGVVASGTAVAEARWGHAVHAVAEGLEPATTYRYRFLAPSGHRAEGTTRTAPADDDDSPAVLAVASCQRYDDGHWAAHRDIAGADVDLVVFLGDYVYESSQRAEPVRPLPGATGVVGDLGGYRSRYEAARRDPHLAAAHAAHPWALTWDDHEVANDHAGTTVDPARRAAAYQAWWEHMPVRVPPPEAGSLPVHRSIRWGATLDLLLLDTRQHRAAPPCGGGLVDTAACAEVADPDRHVLGAEQEAWLLARLADRVRSAAWTTIGSSVLFAPLGIAGRVNGDAWDGFAPARDRISAALAGLDAVVLTGDLHVQLVVDVADPGGTVVASELVAPSISSRASEDLAPFVDLLPVLAPQVRHADAGRRGWLRCDVAADRWVATFREVADVADPDSPVADGAAFEILPGRPGAVPV
jgi:alkaline phosphatase D